MLGGGRGRWQGQCDSGKTVLVWANGHFCPLFGIRVLISEGQERFIGIPATTRGPASVRTQALVCVRSLVRHVRVYSAHTRGRWRDPCGRGKTQGSLTQSCQAQLSVTRERGSPSPPPAAQLSHVAYN